MSAAYCRLAPGDPIHGLYHDTEYGFPTDEESVLFERLMLEINQAGPLLGDHSEKARRISRRLCGFRGRSRRRLWPGRDRPGLLADPGSSATASKIEAATENARRLQELRQSHGSFTGWLNAHHPRAPEAWTKLFRQTFRFTGGQIVGEILMSVGYLPGAHEPDCPVFARVLKTRRPGHGRQCSLPRPTEPQWAVEKRSLTGDMSERAETVRPGEKAASAFRRYAGARR